MCFDGDYEIFIYKLLTVLILAGRIELRVTFIFYLHIWVIFEYKYILLS